MMPEYQARTLSPAPSAGSLHGSPSQKALGSQTVGLAPSASAKSLGASLSMSSLLTVASDTSGPPAVAPPRSATLNTGEVLTAQPLPHAVAAAIAAQAAVQAQPHRPGPPGGQPCPPRTQSRPTNLGVPSREVAVQPSVPVTHGANVAVTQTQTVLGVPYQAVSPPQQAPASQPTWVIEEVIDFGVPYDEGSVRECDDSGYPVGCKPTDRRNSLFDGCVRSLCHDEQQMISARTDRKGRKDSSDLC